MSKIFNAVQKNSVIDFGEICQVDENEVSGLNNAAEQLPATRRSVSPLSESHRVVRLRASASSPIFPLDGGQHPAAEQYRIIRTKLLYNFNKPHLIVVSSASSGDGKTVTSINIAGSLALKGDSRVLLIDGDLRRPRISAELDIPSLPGLTDILSGAVDLDAAIVKAEQFPNLFILPCGSMAANQAELLDSPRWRELLEQIRARFANVIIDAPPVATVADYELLQHSCDGVIFVARPGHSNRAACINALKIVPERKLLGVVLNCVEEWWLWKTPGYGYGYYRNPYSEQMTERSKPDVSKS